MINGVKKGRGLFLCAACRSNRNHWSEGGLHERERMAWYCLAVDLVGMGSHRWSYFSHFTIL